MPIITFIVDIRTNQLIITSNSAVVDSILLQPYIYRGNDCIQFKYNETIAEICKVIQCSEEQNKIYNPWNIVQSDDNLLLPGSDRRAGHDRDSAQQRAVQKQHLPD